MIKKILFSFASLFIGLGLSLWVFNFIGWQEIKTAFSFFSWWQGGIVILLTFFIALLGAWKWKIILNSQGYNFSLRRLLNPYLVGFSITYILPILIFGGEMFRGYFLKEKLSVSWEKSISSIIVDRILEATSLLATIILGIIFFLLAIGLLPPNMELILGGTLIVLVLALAFFYYKVSRKESIAHFFLKFFDPKSHRSGEPLGIEREIFNFFHFQKKALLKGIVLAFSRVGITLLRTWLIVLFLGKSLGFLPVLSILAFDYFAFLAPIPTALGIHEMAQFFAFGALGIGTALAPAFTMIQRGAELILALFGIAMFFKLGIGLLQSLLFKKIKKIENLLD